VGLDRGKPGQQLAPTLEQHTWNCMRWMQLVKRRNWAGETRQCIFKMSMIRRGRCSYVCSFSFLGLKSVYRPTDARELYEQEETAHSVPLHAQSSKLRRGHHISNFSNLRTLQNWCSASIDHLSSAVCTFPLQIVFVSGLKHATAELMRLL
jgi:hypothetical protein